jgi:hypothetical protein
MPEVVVVSHADARLHTLDITLETDVGQTEYQEIHRLFL